MQVVFLITFLLVSAHCTPVREYHSGIRDDYFLNWMRLHQRMKPYKLLPHHLYLQRLYEFLNACWKPPINRATTRAPMLPSPPRTEIAPPLTPRPPGPFTPDRRGDT